MKQFIKKKKQLKMARPIGMKYGSVSQTLEAEIALSEGVKATKR
jgi:hypothetical protein